MIIYGSEVSKRFKEEMKNEVSSLNRAPSLCVILVGDNPASLSYIRGKEKACNEIGIKFTLLKADEKDREAIAEVIIERDYTVKETEDYIDELYNRYKKEKGVSNNIKIGINTIKQAYELCRKSGLDASIQETDYEKEVKIVIRFKK